jgi:iron complex transport system ATP-binding protein
MIDIGANEVPYIVGKGVRFSYGSNVVLDGVDFEIKSGRFVGLLGPNGCGKTTLIGLISGTHKFQKGEISIGGNSVGEISAREMARFLAVVPQFNSINFAFTSLEIVLMGRYPFKERFGRFSREDIELCLKCMATTDTIRFSKRPANMLSGGERQRVILARALAQQPRVLILDEATSNLDIRHTISFMATVRKLSQINGITVISAMHDLNLAAMFCDEVILMSNQKIQASGPASDVLTEENIESVYETPVRVERPLNGRPSVHLEVPDVDVLHL